EPRVLLTAALVRDINSGAAGSSPSAPVAFQHNLYFVASGGNGPAPWRSDGTAAGTAPVAAGATTGPVVGGTMFFAEGNALWKTDGYNTNTNQVRTFAAKPANLFAVNG